MSFLRVVVFAFLTAKKINMQSNKLIPAPHPDNDRADVLSMCGESVSSSRRCTLLQSCTVRGPLPRASPLLLSFVFSPFLVSSLLCSALLCLARLCASLLFSPPFLFPLSSSLLFSSLAVSSSLILMSRLSLPASFALWSTWRPLELHPLFCRGPGDL